MKRILLLSLSFSFIVMAQAQKDAKKPITAYAITGAQKGNSAWTEVRLIDITTGEEIQTVYASTANAEILNARTGKAVVKKDVATTTQPSTEEPPTRMIKKDEAGHTYFYSKKLIAQLKPQYDQPFATTSAACAYDKKHNRLYYTPMGINQLRYIDLKAKSPKFYYFEDEAFGTVKSRSDVGAQITRMVIAGDGKGYALSNDGNHLIQFTVKKKPEITDLGAITDDLTNGRFSVHSSASYGGDMIADKDGNLYLITANRAVYKISIESKVASYIGTIKNLPRGFSTNGAVAQGDSKVIVSSSGSTAGYYRFDLNTLEAEKISESSAVYNASDLASATLAFEKKDKEEEKPKEMSTISARVPGGSLLQEVAVKNAIAVYPNPVTEGYFKLSFADQKPGRYQVQLMDAAGKIISSKSVNINNKVQVEEVRIPQQVAAGNYIVKVISEDGLFTNTNKVIVR